MAFQYAHELSFEDKMLWAAVLRRAVYDYVLYKGVRSKSIEWKHAFRYVFEKDLEYENGLNFDEVCELFNWNPDYLRTLATRLTREDIRKMESSRFRGDFTYDMVELIVESRECWKDNNFAMPFQPLYGLVDSYREKALLRPVRRERLMTADPPMVDWSDG